MGLPSLLTMLPAGAACPKGLDLLRVSDSGLAVAPVGPGEVGSQDSSVSLSRVFYHLGRWGWSLVTPGLAGPVPWGIHPPQPASLCV